jgi:Zn-dependent protease
MAPSLKSCPSCRRLVHAEELRRIAERAERATRENQLSAALAAWREALALLPRESGQFEKVSARIGELSKVVDRSPGLHSRSTESQLRTTVPKALAALGATGLLLWKFKFVLVFVLTKLKLLLGGLTKASTFFSMILSLGVYWAAWGWKFALGLVASMYVHEMGHVAALRRFGIAATAPMFVPGLGALVRLNQYPADAREDARVGLAGPLWGLGAAVAAYLTHLATGWASWAAIARVAAWLNLFNLLPIWQLDGGRGFRALSRPNRGLVAAVAAVMWFLTREGFLALILLAAAARAFSREAPAETDVTALVEFVGLLIALSLLSAIPVPGLEIR